MAKIQPEDKRERIEEKIKLHPDLAQELDDYSRYLSGSSKHYIVSAALKTLFRSDADFKEWRKLHPAGATEPPEGSRRRWRGKAAAAGA